MVKQALGLAGLALGAAGYLWGRSAPEPRAAIDTTPVVAPAPTPERVEVQAPHEAPATEAAPVAAPAPPGAPSPDAAARPAPRKHTAATPVARQPLRGAAFSAFMTKYVPAEQLPKALGLLADTCEQSRGLIDDAMAHLAADEGKRKDYAAEGAAARAIRDLNRDLTKALAALPGSQFDKGALIELTTSETYLNDCMHANGDDE
jgi:hypothetical protein